MKNELTDLQSDVLKIVSKARKPIPRSHIQFQIYGTTTNRNNDRAIQVTIKALRVRKAFQQRGQIRLQGVG